MTALPDKLYFKIGEVARIAEVPPHVLRYWESEFTVITPKRTNSGQRLYKQEDVRRILELKVLLHEKGYTIAGAKKLLSKKRKSDKEVKEKPPQYTTSNRLQQLKKEVLEIQKIVSL